MGEGPLTMATDAAELERLRTLLRSIASQTDATWAQWLARDEIGFTPPPAAPDQHDESANKQTNEQTNGPKLASGGLVQEVADGLRRFTWRARGGHWWTFDKDLRLYIDGPFEREAEAGRLARKRTAQAIIDLVRSGEADA